MRPFAEVAVVEGVLRNEVRGHRQLRRGVFAPVAGQHVARVVRRGERHVHQERVVGRRLGLQESDGGVGIEFRRECFGQRVRPCAVPVVVVARRVVLVEVGPPVAQFVVSAVGVHSPEENVRSRGERTVERGVVAVPLPGCEGRVTVLAEHLREGLLRFGNEAAVAVHVHQAAPGEEHRTAGLRNGAVQAAHHVGLGERHAAPHEPVHVRGVDFGISQRPDRVERLIVGQQEKHVGTPGPFAVVFGSLLAGSVRPEQRSAQDCRKAEQQGFVIHRLFI